MQARPAGALATSVHRSSRASRRLTPRPPTRPFIAHGFREPRNSSVEQGELMNQVKAWAASSATSPLAATTIPRRAPVATDVEIEILFCGICHSDLHMVRNEWSAALPTV